MDGYVYYVLNVILSEPNTTQNINTETMNAVAWASILRAKGKKQ